MKLPWFMHMHGGENTLVGVMPTPHGSFVRSAGGGRRMEVSWYPMDLGFPGGASREVKRLAIVDPTDAGETELENAVVDFMHAHPDLATVCRFDPPAGEALGWSEVGGGALATLETPQGLFFRINHGGQVTLEFLPSTGTGMRESIGTFADSCGEGTVAKRVDARVRRRLARANAGSDMAQAA